MKIFYVHHALRDIGNPPTQDDGLKELGIKDANIVADIFEDGKRYMNVKAIYTSPFYRCKETARLINKHLNAPIREVYEEFGITVKPIKKVYVYETEKSVECFYLCDWISGEFGTGVGEEFDVNSNKEGVYIPKLIDISSIPNLPLMPKEVASSFYEDYTNNGISLRQDVKHVIV